MAASAPARFYAKFAECFELNSRWSIHNRVPRFGDDATDMAEVDDFWYSFKYWCDFSFDLEYDTDQAERREEKRDIARYSSRSPRSAAGSMPGPNRNVAATVGVPSRFQELPELGEDPLGFMGTEAQDSNNVTNHHVVVNTSGMDNVNAANLINNLPSFPMTPLSLGTPAPQSVRSSMDGHMRRRTIEADVERYGRRNHSKSTQAGIHHEVAELHRNLSPNSDNEFSEKDLEVRRRLLTAILSHVRAVSNTRLIEFSVVHNLEEDCQKALDANEEGRPYDLFSFLDNQSKLTRGPLFQLFIKVLEGRSLRGEMAITTAFIISGIMTEILKEETLHESPIVQWQAKKLYQGSATLLNRLESLNPEAFEWVQSQFAVYVCERRQDTVLEDLLESGIVDDEEYHTLHEELIEVRREYASHRQSLLKRNRKRLPKLPPPRQLLLKHPLFQSLSRDLMQTIDRYGELVHLKSGQSLKSERGSLIVVLDGLLRPMGEYVLPKQVAHQIKKSNTQVTLVAKDRSAGLRTVQGTPENAWDRAYAANDNNNANNNNNMRSTIPDDADVQMGGDRATGFTSLGAGAGMHWCFPS